MTTEAKSTIKPTNGKATTEISRLDERIKNINKGLLSMQDQFQAAMPTGGEAKQLIRDVTTAVRKLPELAACDPTTLYGAAMTAAQLNLRIGVLGQCWILPYKDQATFVAGYKGLIQLAHRSGMVSSIGAEVVYERDDWEFYKRDGKLHMLHRPYIDGDPGQVVRYYADVTKLDGGYAITVPWGVEKMRAHRAKWVKVKSAKSPWWQEEPLDYGLLNGFHKMGKKTMIIVMANVTPMGTDLANALVADNSVRVDLDPREDIAHVSERVIDGDLVDETTGEVIESGWAEEVKWPPNHSGNR